MTGDRAAGDRALLAHCKEPRHRELFAAVVDATRARSVTRLGHTERAAELDALRVRHEQTLDALPDD